MTELENKINRILFSYERAEAVKMIAKFITDELQAQLTSKDSQMERMQARIKELELEKSFRDFPDRMGGWFDPNDRHEMGG